MPEKPATTEPKRRWYQFRLRTLLIGVVIAAMLCPLGVRLLHEWQAQRDKKPWMVLSPGFSDAHGSIKMELRK